MRRFLFGKKFGCWLVSAALFLLSGCGSLTKFRTLGSDAVDRQSGYTSVVMWKLRIIDRTGLSKGSAPEFQIAVGGDHVRPRQGRWTEGEGAAYYECLYVTEAKNHDFNLWKISIYFKSRGSLDIFPKITWRVTPDSLLYIGAFDVEILELVRGKKGWEAKYNLKILREPDDLKNTLETFSVSHPNVYSALKDRGGFAPQYIVAEDFGLFSWQKWPELKQQAAFDAYKNHARINSTYSLVSKKEGCFRVGISPDKKLSKDYDIEFKSTWVSGVAHTAYGLCLGDDADRFYCFCISGNGQAMVNLYRDKAFLQKPVIDWKKNAAPAGDGETPNYVRIEVRGKKIRYFVNDGMIGECENTLKLEPWFIGFMACGVQEVLFDDLYVVMR